MLDACHRKKCLWYDYRDGKWLFDLDGVFKQFNMGNSTDSLREDFITSRLNELPVASRSIFTWASMLGSSFSFQLIQRLLNFDFTPIEQNHQPDDVTTPSAVALQE